MRLWRDRRFVTQLGPEECERLIWLLNGQTIPIPSTSFKIHGFIIAQAQRQEFALWTVAVSNRPFAMNSSLRLHGRWESVPNGTSIETWWTPSAWLVRGLGTVLAGFMLLGALGVFWSSAFHYLTGDNPWWVIGGAFLLVLILTSVVIKPDATDKRLARLLATTLRDPEAIRGTVTNPRSNRPRDRIKRASR